MKKTILLTLFLTAINVHIIAQVSISAIVTPRIEMEETSQVNMGPRKNIKANTYFTLNSTVQKKQFFFDFGIGVMQRFNQSYNRSGTVKTGGGSGEIYSSSFYYSYNLNYTYLQTKFNLGGVLELNKLRFFIGVGTQIEFLMKLKLQAASSKMNVEPLQEPRKSIYLKLNPRWTLPNKKFFLEFNSLFGTSLNQLPHIKKFSFSNPSYSFNLFYETGIGMGYQF